MAPARKDRDGWRPPGDDPPRDDLVRGEAETGIPFFDHMIDTLAKNKPSTAATRYQALQQFFKFLVEEGEITESPMRNMKQPPIPDGGGAPLQAEAERPSRGHQVTVLDVHRQKIDGWGADESRHDPPRNGV